MVNKSLKISKKRSEQSSQHFLTFLKAKNVCVYVSSDEPRISNEP
jgi:hypothetical protein